MNLCEGCGEQTCDTDECLGVREPNRAGTAHAYAEHHGFNFPEPITQCFGKYKEPQILGYMGFGSRIWPVYEDQP